MRSAGATDFVLPQHELLLRHVTPPAVRVRQMRTSCAGVSSNIRGCVRSRGMLSCDRRQMRPRLITLSSWYCSIRARRYVPGCVHCPS